MQYNVFAWRFLTQGMHAGKPHPRWADSNFCDGDATEKWHSRSSKRLQVQSSRQRRDDIDTSIGRQGEHITSQMASTVKAEQLADTQSHNHTQLYRLSPDDSQLIHETTNTTTTSSSPASHAYRNQRSMQQHYGGHYSPIEDPGLAYSPTTSIDSANYGEQRHTNGTANGDYYQTAYERHLHSHLDPGSTSSSSYASCTCLSNQTIAHPILLSLSNQLQNSLDLLKRLPEHNGRHHCAIVKRVVELDSIIQYVFHLPGLGFCHSLAEASRESRAAV